MPKIAAPSRTGLIFIGVDPGKTGGVTWIVHSTGRRVVVVNKMPETERDIWDLIRGAGGQYAKVCQRVAVIEKVTGYIKDVPTPGSYMFNFGENYGLLRMALVAADLPFIEGNTSKWMTGIGIPKIPGEERDDRKRRFRGIAQQRFPDAVGNQITLQTADSVLLAEYCMRVTMGSLICVTRSKS